MDKKYLKVIEALGEVLISKETDNKLLQYENERLKETILKLEREK